MKLRLARREDRRCYLQIYKKGWWKKEFRTEWKEWRKTWERESGRAKLLIRVITKYKANADEVTIKISGDVFKLGR